MPPEPQKILADRIAPMQWALINEAIMQCHGVQVVANDIPASALADAVGRYDPDLLILGNKDTQRSIEFVHRWLQSASPRKRVLTLFEGHAAFQLSEWRIVQETLTDLSLGALRDVIEGRR